MNAVNAMREEQAEAIMSELDNGNIDTETAANRLQALGYDYDYIWDAMIENAPVAS